MTANDFYTLVGAFILSSVDSMISPPPSFIVSMEEGLIGMC